MGEPSKMVRDAERTRFLEWVYADCLVPGATTNVEWQDEEPYYNVLDSGARFDLIGEWDAWCARASIDAQAATLHALRGEAQKDKAALTEALEYAESMEDVVDGEDGNPKANGAMRLAAMLRKHLAGGA